MKQDVTGCVDSEVQRQNISPSRIERHGSSARRRRHRRPAAAAASSCRGARSPGLSFSFSYGSSGRSRRHPRPAAACSSPSDRSSRHRRSATSSSSTGTCGPHSRSDGSGRYLRPATTSSYSSGARSEGLPCSPSFSSSARSAGAEETEAGGGTSPYYKIRATVADLRLRFIQVYEATDFRKSDAAREILREIKTVMELSKKMRLDLSGSSEPVKPLEKPLVGAVKDEPTAPIPSGERSQVPQTGQTAIPPNNANNGVPATQA